MSNEIVARLKDLRLHGMAANWPELVAHNRHSALEPEALMRGLLDAEAAERDVRSIGYQHLVANSAASSATVARQSTAFAATAC